MKKLIVREPLLSTYPEYGSVFSIIPDNELSENWMYSNFVQYYVKKNNLFVSGEELLVYKDHVNFISTVPTLQHYKISEHILHMFTKESLIEALIDFLDNDFYIILLLDRSYIRESRNYKKSPFVHMTLIYGYDEDNEDFYIADNNNYGKYDFLQYKFEDVANAFKAMNYNDFRDTQTINLIRPFNHIHYNFDLDYLIKELKFYLSSYDLKDTYLKNWNPYNPLNYGHDGEVIEYYNLGIYEYLKKIINRENNYIGIQPFHLVWENKKFMLKRIEFLKSRGYIDDCEDILLYGGHIVGELQIIINLLIKFNITKATILKSSILTKIDFIKEKDIEFVRVLLEKLS